MKAATVELNGKKEEVAEFSVLIKSAIKELADIRAGNRAADAEYAVCEHRRERSSIESERTSVMLRQPVSE